MSLSSPTLTSPDKSPGYQMGLTSTAAMDSETSRRIDTICSQLATRGSSHGEVKQEPGSPGGSSCFPPGDMSPHRYPSDLSPRGDAYIGGRSSPTSTINSNAPPQGGFTSLPSLPSLPPFSSTLARSHSNPVDVDQLTHGHKDGSPIQASDPHHRSHGGLSPRFMPPARRSNSMMNVNSAVNLRQGNSSQEHVRSIADSTSNLTEFFSTLQGLVQRSQEIPELNVNISKPKVSNFYVLY